MKAARSSRNAREAAIEEGLRLESPVQWNVRMAMRDYELRGTTIKAGTLVLLAYGAANRDERHFTEPELMDVDRANTRTHLSFGHGLHFCLGAPLARLEGKAGLTALVDGTKSIELT